MPGMDLKATLAGRLPLLYEPRYSMPATVFLHWLWLMISANPFTSGRPKGVFQDGLIAVCRFRDKRLFANLDAQVIGQAVLI